jgi:transcriptional antiterminator Rof (Rho-off)
MQDYLPIACHIHDIYEIAIMRRTALKLVWLQAGIRRHDTVQPVDLCTKDDAEWLLAEDSTGKPLSIRLDWILEARST